MIGDRDAVARLLHQLVNSRFHGNQSAAARAAALRPSDLNRLLHGKLSAVRPGTVEALQHLFSPRERIAFDDALLGSQAETALAEAAGLRAWAHDARHLGRRWFYGQYGMTDPAAGAERERRRRQRTLFLQLEWDEVRPSASNDLEAAVAAVELGKRKVGDLNPDEIRQALTESGRERLRLAWDRMLEPLLDADESGGIERVWEEFSQRERIDFIEASLKRERILLRRSSDMQRAHQAPRVRALITDLDAGAVGESAPGHPESAGRGQ